MTHSFMRFTSNGGYIGRICWCNKDAPGNERLFGSITMMPDSILDGWAGSIPIVRFLTR